MRELAEWQFNKKREKGMLIDVAQSNKFSLQVLHSLPMHSQQHPTPQKKPFHFISFLCTNNQIYQTVKHLGFVCGLTNSHYFLRGEQEDSLNTLA